MNSKSRKSLGTALLALLLAGVLAGAQPAQETPTARPAPTKIKLRITHRVFVDFLDTLTVAMNERHNVGDTEFTFEVIEFYPDFAIDTNKVISSLSDDPKNPAFKVAVYENGEKAEETWAFYGIDIPHYGRKSYLAFKVLGFEYRGQVLGKAAAAPQAAKGEEKKQ